MALYNEKNIKIDEYRPETTNAILELIFSFSTIQLTLFFYSFEKFFKLAKSASISPSAL